MNLVCRTVPIVLLALMAACSAPIPAPAPPVPQAAAAPAPDPAILAEFHRLRALFAEQVPSSSRPVSPSLAPAGDDAAWTAAARAELARSAITLDRPQLVVVVDRAPKAQDLRIMLADPSGDPSRPWRTIGAGKVSTGQCERRGYFITPTGVFQHTDGILDYRAEGTVNEQGIRGLGIKGMRVWDFGWQMAEPGWGTDRAPREIRLQMHATDPAYLEQRLGRPASKGCIRVSTAMNRFLDIHGVLDADYERAAPADPRIAAVLRPERTPTSLAGTLLIVIEGR